MQVKDSVIVITGAASGIGEATAMALAAAGAKIVLGDMNEERLLEVQAAIIKNGHQAAARSVNVTDESSVQSFMDFAVQQYSKINVVLASAGITRDSFFISTDRETGKVKSL